jgi:hypothetical protein
MCSRCDAGAPLDCGDCNGKPFGLATTEECTALNKLAVSGADASFNFTSPNCLLQPKDGQGAIFPVRSSSAPEDGMINVARIGWLR